MLASGAIIPAEEGPEREKKPVKEVPIEVECYSGYKYGEKPRKLRIEGVEYAVQEILDTWYEGSAGSGRPPRTYFKVLTDDGSELIVLYDPGQDSWRLVRR